MSDGRLQRRADGSRSAVSGRRRSRRWASETEVRAALADRLRERLPELQEAIATRIFAISDPGEVADQAYLQSLNAALAAAVEYRLEVLEAGERQAPDIPPVLLAQARLDARNGVSLDTVLRRYVAGNALFGDFLAAEAERAGIPGSALRRLLAAQATLGDRLLAAVSAEHAREAQSRPLSIEERLREVVKSLLAGELVDHSELPYEFDAHHLGLMAKGAAAEELVAGLGSRFDRQMLAGRREEEPIWAAWLGGQRPLTAEEVLADLADVVPDGVAITVGEPGEGLAGWRHSHFQAKAALPIAERKGRRVLGYADVALLASVARDDLIATSLRQLYLAPLERARDGGEIARKTLRAYFEAERNISSTAAALGVDRRTVRNRLGAVEELLGRPIKGSVPDMEIALQLDDS